MQIGRVHKLRRILRFTNFALSFNFIGTIIAKPFYTFKSVLIFICKNRLWKITKIITAVRVNLNVTFMALEQEKTFVVCMSKLQSCFFRLSLLQGFLFLWWCCDDRCARSYSLDGTDRTNLYHYLMKTALRKHLKNLRTQNAHYYAQLQKQVQLNLAQILAQN